MSWTHEGYEMVVGLEVHVELNTASKMFCGCPAVFGGEPNAGVCPTCLGLPGAMPVVNGKAVESAIRIGLALNCEIAEWCRFARKNYFYPDMPKNFQTSQYDEPIAFEGWMDVEVEGETFRIDIERAHMEEDTGKSLHVGGATGRIHGADHSLLDYNRRRTVLKEYLEAMRACSDAAGVGIAPLAQAARLAGALQAKAEHWEKGRAVASVEIGNQGVEDRHAVAAALHLGAEDRLGKTFRGAVQVELQPEGGSGRQTLGRPAAEGLPDGGRERRLGQPAEGRELHGKIHRSRVRRQADFEGRQNVSGKARRHVPEAFEGLPVDQRLGEPGPDESQPVAARRPRGPLVRRP